MVLLVPRVPLYVSSRLTSDPPVSLASKRHLFSPLVSLPHRVLLVLLVPPVSPVLVVPLDLRELLVLLVPRATM